MSTTTNSNQETVIQETDVADVAQDLENFGIIKSAASRLIQHYPAAYIREKVAMAQGLVTAGSSLVSQNPAGWLRRAIEEDCSLPRTSESHRQRSVRDKQAAKPCTRRYGAKLVPAEPREQHLAEEEPQSVQNVPTEPTETNTEKIEPEKPNRENETIWHKALEHLQAALPLGEAETRLQGTTLVELTATTARIWVPSTHALLWLERRLYREITNAMKGVLGKDLDVSWRPRMLSSPAPQSGAPEGLRGLTAYRRQLGSHLSSKGKKTMNLRARKGGVMQQPHEREVSVYADIGEVRMETRAADYKQLLADSWVLLGVYPLTRVEEAAQGRSRGEKEQKQTQEGQQYVRRLVGYVLGRRRA